jgi:hypothetical protein
LRASRARTRGGENLVLRAGVRVGINVQDLAPRAVGDSAYPRPLAARQLKSLAGTPGSSLSGTASVAAPQQRPPDPRGAQPYGPPRRRARAATGPRSAPDPHPTELASASARGSRQRARRRQLSLHTASIVVPSVHDTSARRRCAIRTRAAPASVERQQRRADCSYPCQAAATGRVAPTRWVVIPFAAWMR